MAEVYIMRATMIYSKSAEASVKRIVDLAIVGADFRNSDRIDFEKENYLKELIRISSNNTITVNGLADKVQFFFIKGGAEGFLDNTYTGIDASRITRQGATTAGGASDVFVFDDTCLLAVFDPRGKLISSALVSRPISITGIWTEKTANAVLDAWDKSPVDLYHNQNFPVKYYGIKIMDTAGWYANKWARIDIHKTEDTNGCMFITDVNTPNNTGDAAGDQRLSQFEPQLIKDIQAAIGAREKNGFGLMRVIKLAK
jgi:hypothetical protein